MNLKKATHVSIRQLLINKAKSIFAVAGLAIGIASVITMVAIGDGAKRKALSSLEEAGSNLIVINAGRIKNVSLRRQNSDVVTSLRMKDVDALRYRCPSVKEIVPGMDRNMNVKFGSIHTKALIHGVTTPYFKIKSFVLEKGVFFSEEDNRNLLRVAVLGGQVSETLFGNESPVGKIILVNRIPFTVLGVLKNKGISGEGANLDVQILIPINTAMRRVFNVDYLKRIFIEVETKEKLGRAEKEIISVLRDTHYLDKRNKEDDFTIDNQLAALQSIEESSRSFTLLITGVAAVAILVGGIGILAVMLLSVKERTGEIGLRISVGAKRKDISLQFLMESTILGFAGGIVGLASGVVISIMVKLFTSWQISITFSPIIIAFLFSVLIGLTFGVVPARRASMVVPIMALQKE